MKKTIGLTNKQNKALDNIVKDLLKIKIHYEETIQTIQTQNVILIGGTPFRMNEIKKLCDNIITSFKELFPEENLTNCFKNKEKKS